MPKMTIKEAIDYLQDIADNAEIANYSAALAAAIDAMREVEKLWSVVDECRTRSNMQSSEIVRLWDRIREQEAELNRYRKVEDNDA